MILSMSGSKRPVYTFINSAFIPGTKPEVYHSVMTENADHAGHRLKTALRISGKTQRALAEHCDVTPQAVNKWIRTGKVGRDNLAHAAEFLDVGLAWLATGRGEPEPAYGPARGSGAPSPIRESSPETWTRGNREAPVLGWEQVVDWCAGKTRQARQWREVPAETGHRAFWLHVRGDAMVTPHGSPSISEGSLILVDPDLPHENGSLVIARLPDSTEVTFKKLVLDAGRTFLVPLNPRYAPLAVDEGHTILGTVRKMEFDFNH